MSRSMFDTYLSTKLPFYLSYIKVEVKVEVKGQCQRSGSQVKVKGTGQGSMSRSNVLDTAVNTVTNQVLTFLGLNENEKKNMVKP